jgi:hypothetical protein
MENVQEEMISNAALVQEVVLMEIHQKINSLDHAQEVVELALMLMQLLVKRIWFLVDALEEVVLNVAWLGQDLHGI